MKDEMAQVFEGANLPSLSPMQIEKFNAYLELIIRWNSRMNLTAIREEKAIIDRHLVECIACANALPDGIATLLDFGSGAGLPGVPIAICRQEIVVTLAESQSKKAAFLQEVVRSLGLGAKVHTGRAEQMESEFDCVALRAVDQMHAAIKAASKVVRPGGWLAVMTTDPELDKVKAGVGSDFSWRETVHLPGSDQRILALGEKAIVRA